MSTGRDELALRKQMLLAQCALYRAQLGAEVLAARSRAARVSGWIALATTLVSAVRTIAAIVSIVRR